VPTIEASGFFGVFGSNSSFNRCRYES
jgi:hypothetical protein